MPNQSCIPLIQRTQKKAAKSHDVLRIRVCVFKCTYSSKGDEVLPLCHPPSSTMLGTLVVYIHSPKIIGVSKIPSKRPCNPLAIKILWDPNSTLPTTYCYADCTQMGSSPHVTWRTYQFVGCPRGGKWPKERNLKNHGGLRTWWHNCPVIRSFSFVGT